MAELSCERSVNPVEEGKSKMPNLYIGARCLDSQIAIGPRYRHASVYPTTTC
jgi:hypothetical protein